MNNGPPSSADAPGRRRISFLIIVAGCNLLVVAVLLTAWLMDRHGPPSPDWNGTWKLDTARSTLPARTLTVSIAADGTYRSSAGGSEMSFRCDGKERQATDILTAFCTQKSSSDLAITAFRNGSKVLTAEWELSPDGKTLTVESRRYHADGSVKPRETLYQRTSGSAGFPGGWKDVNRLDGSGEIWQISVRNGAVHFSWPERDIHGDARFDGTDAAIQGQLASPGSSIALVKRSPREFEVTNKMHGRVVSNGDWRISGDGRSLTESYWLPGRPSQRIVRVYDKQ